MIGSYIFRFVDKAKATNNLKMNGKGVKSSMENDEDNNGNGQLVLDSRTKAKKPSMSISAG